MNLKEQELKVSDIASLITLVIGGIFGIVNPEHSSNIFLNTMVSIIVIKSFWK